MIHKQWIFALLTTLTLASVQSPAIAQYGPPTSGSSSAILFAPATVGLVAGLNGQGSSGNGGLATAAQLNYPVGIAYDSSGNLFVADASNYVVRRIDHITGVISIFAGTNATFGDSLGGGVATSAQLGIVAGLVIDTSNNVYVSDRSNNVVWKITSGGTISLYAGGGSSGLGDGGLATSAELNNPWALGIDASNNIYISDSYNNLVREVNHTTNIITTFAGDIADAGACSAGGLYSTSTPPYTPTQAHLCFPEGVAFDSSGNAYIVDASHAIVRVVNKATGYISTFAGGGTQASSVNGIPATSAIIAPSGVFVDPGNRVYISSSNLVRVVDSSGNINTVFGTGGGSLTSAILGEPDTESVNINVGPVNGVYDMAMDTFGNLITASSSGNTILTAGTTGQYVFPQTQIFTTETTTQQNAFSSFYPPYITVSNPSGVTLNFTAAPVVTGPFAVVTGTGAGTCVFPSGSVAPGQSCTIVVSFTPTLGGSPGTVQTGTVTLASNANSAPSTILLSGTGTGTATVSATLTTSPLSFTSPAGVTSAAQNATLTNTGQLPIAVGSTNFNGFNPTDFAVSTTTCPSGAATLAVGASCTYSITFTPPAATSYQAGFQVCISTSSYGCLPSIVVQGTGTAGATATLLPTPLAFGNVTAGQTSAAMSATLSNTSSTTAMTISSFTIAGTNPGDFAVGTGTNACGSTLAANSSCVVYVTFTPASIASFSAQLSVADSATGSPQTVALSGTGIPGAVPPSPLVFNPAPVGILLASAQTLTATFHVNGFSTGFTPTAKLHYGLSYSIGAVTCTGPTGTLTCSVPVTFQPQYPGGRREALFLMNGPARLASVLIYGIGQSPFALVQPGVVTTPLVNTVPYNYSSIVDESGTVYDVQENGNTIVAVTKAGVATTLPITGLNSPRQVGIDGAGVLYIVDQTSHGPATTYDTVQGIQGSVPFPAGTGYEQGIAVGNTGNIYETDYQYVYTIPIVGSGTAATTLISPSNTQAGSLAVDSNEDIFATGYAINEITSGGTQTQVNTTGTYGSTGVDAAGTLYGARAGLGGVTELPASAYGSFEAGLDPSASPEGASVGPDGTVYDGNYNDLDKIDRSQGMIAFGQVGATASQNVSIYNGGNQPLTITNIAISGAGFTYAAANTSPCVLNAAIAPGALCQVTVTLTAPHAGFYAGTLTYTDNSLNGTASTQNVALSGMSYGDYLVASPTSLNFNTQSIGTTSPAQTITLTNYGESYTATVAPITGSGPFNFSLGTCTSPLAPATSATVPGGSCQLSVTFSPTTTTPYNNTQVGIVATSSGFPNVVIYATVSGTGTTGAPSATLSPTSLSFPSTTVGVAATSLPVTLSNPGTTALTISSISIAGTNAGSFSQTSNCGSSVAAGGSCTINVGFTPTAAGSLSASLTVVDNATGSPQTLAITGTGAAASTPQAQLTPNPLPFPSTTVGTPATNLPITLSNPGTTALAVSSISITGTNSTSFSQTSNCGSSVAAGGSCTINVGFTPTATGNLSASITVTDNATGSPQSIALTGIGAAALVPQATFNPASLTFPSTAVGTSATTLPITLSNPGTAALAISGISITGTNATSFGQTNTCGTSLAAGASCTITVSFTPTAAGGLTASISVADNATASPQTVAISGTGSSPVAGGAFTVSSSTPAATVQPGATAQFNLVIAPLGGTYNNLVTLSATGLPSGAVASFLPAAVTPGSGGAPSVMSIQTSAGLARLELPDQHGRSPVPLLAMLAGLPLLGFAGNLRRLRKCRGRWMLLGLATLAILPLLALSGCGGGYFGPAPKTYAVTVTGTSGSLQESTTISLTVQ